MASKNIFSVKSTLYPKGRAREVDGPWKPTVEEAVTAYVAKIKRQGLEQKLVFRPFLVERVEKDRAPCMDGKGNYYQGTEVDVVKRLKLMGLQVDATA